MTTNLGRRVLADDAVELARQIQVTREVGLAQAAAEITERLMVACYF
jgi:hypothetical protein